MSTGDPFDLPMPAEPPQAPSPHNPSPRHVAAAQALVDLAQRTGEPVEQWIRDLAAESPRSSPATPPGGEEHREVSEAERFGGMSVNDSTSYCSCGERFKTRLGLRAHLTRFAAPSPASPAGVKRPCSVHGDSMNIRCAECHTYPASPAETGVGRREKWRQALYAFPRPESSAQEAFIDAALALADAEIAAASPAVSLPGEQPGGEAVDRVLALAVRIEAEIAAYHIPGTQTVVDRIRAAVAGDPDPLDAPALPVEQPGGEERCGRCDHAKTVHPNGNCEMDHCGCWEYDAPALPVERAAQEEKP